MENLQAKIESVIDEKLRPQLLLHGGGMETVRLEGGRYVFRLTGQCAGCPSAYLTTEEVILEVATILVATTAITEEA